MKGSSYQISGIDSKLQQHYQGRLDNLTKPVASTIETRDFFFIEIKLL